MPGLRAGIGRFAGDVFGAIGSVTPYGRATRGMPAMFAAQRQKNLIKYGKYAVGYGIMGASAVKMAASKRSTGAYNPASRPMTSAPSGVGRSA